LQCKKGDDGIPLSGFTKNGRSKSPFTGWLSLTGLEHLEAVAADAPGRGEMRFQTCCRRRTVKSVISAHRKTRAMRRMFEIISPLPLSFLLSPANRWMTLYERRVLRGLVAVEPIDPEEAREKFLYLTALLVAKSIDPPTQEVAIAIETLRPFKEQLAATVSRGRSGFVHTSSQL
jgi:hypothetical protein